MLLDRACLCFPVCSRSSETLQELSQFHVCIAQTLNIADNLSSTLQIGGWLGIANSCAAIHLHRIFARHPFSRRRYGPNPRSPLHLQDNVPMPLAEPRARFREAQTIIYLARR
jgi:hypothetical protein